MMQAVVFDAKDKQLELTKRPRPKIVGPFDVLIKIFYSGVCALDLGVLEGQYAFLVKSPTVLGHEIAGVVGDVGPEVTLLKKGDKVVVDPTRSCGKCAECYGGRSNYCKAGGYDNIVGYGTDGGWAEYVVVLERQVFKVPERITLELAVLTHPLSCIMHAWNNLTPVSVDQKVLIVGVGLFGNLWAALLHLEGHRKVVLVESNLCRRDAHKKLETGFQCVTLDQLLDAHLVDPSTVFDIIIYTDSVTHAIENTLSLLDMGGKLCIFGLAKPADTIKISPYLILKKELKIIGSMTNPSSFPKALAYLECLGERYITFEKLNMKTYPLENYKEVISHVQRGHVLKGVFQMEISCVCRRISK